MSQIRYNYSSTNHIKSSRALERTCYPFSSRNRGADTMSDHTLPLFSLQPETREIPLTRGQVAIVDAADYEWISQWKWLASRGPNDRTFYASRTVYTPDGKKLTAKMHRVILGIDDPAIWVDHIDGNGLNNTRANLRAVTPEQNFRNRRIPANNTSGFKGVSWYAAREKWGAYITFDKKRMFLGLFLTAEEAARTYDDAALQLYGEYARLNFPRESVNARRWLHYRWLIAQSGQDTHDAQPPTA